VGLEAFDGFGESLQPERVAHQGMRGVVEERESADDVGVAGTGAILAHDGVTLPVIADFGALPVAAHDGQPLRVGAFGRCETGDEVSFQAGLLARGLVEEPTDNGEEGLAIGDAGLAGLKRLDADASFFDAAADRFGQGKKGARSRRDWAA
jgi:hypothetical protein